MVTSNVLRQRRSTIDLQSQTASAVETQRITPSDQNVDAKRFKLAELQVGLAFFSFVLIGVNDGAFGVLIPSLQTQYSVDKATIGLLFLVQSTGYLVAAFTSGLLIEKLGNRRFLMLGVVYFLFGVGALALMLPFMIVLVTMLPLGLGVGIIDAGINAYIASMPRNAAPFELSSRVLWNRSSAWPSHRFLSPGGQVGLE